MEINITTKNALFESERFIKSITAYPDNYGGKGIIICAGGVRFYTCAWVCINMLRYFNCHLPIELWYLGPKELDSQMKGLLEPLGVECIDAFKLREQYPSRKLDGWELKSYALLHSRFKEILLLDSDNVPTVNPEYLFETTQFIETGAIFWPDIGRLRRTRPIWKICGVDFRNEPEFESGQILINKQKCWKPLNLAMWYNEHSDFYYRYVHGDKETFHMAFRKTEHIYTMISKPVILKSGVMYQHSIDGKVIFQHRNGPKWNYYGENPRILEFQYEGKCFEYLEQLKKKWSGSINLDLNNSSDQIKCAVDVLTSNLMLYNRIGYDSRPMSFLKNGTIDIGSAVMERFWDIYENNSDLYLKIIGDKMPICNLKLNGSKWEGNWLAFEKMPIELSPMNT